MRMNIQFILFLVVFILSINAIWAGKQGNCASQMKINPIQTSTSNGNLCCQKQSVKIIVDGQDYKDGEEVIITYSPNFAATSQESVNMVVVTIGPLPITVDVNFNDSTLSNYYIYARVYNQPDCLQQSVLVVNQFQTTHSICVQQQIGNTPNIWDSTTKYYTHISEYPYAIPLTADISATNSDMIGESSNSKVSDSKGDQIVISPSSDIEQFYVTYDKENLYLAIEGPNLCTDGIDMFIAIRTGGVSGYTTTHSFQYVPGSKTNYNTIWLKSVDFAGWEPNYFIAIESVSKSNTFAAIYDEKFAELAKDDSLSDSNNFDITTACNITPILTQIRIPYKVFGGTPSPITGMAMQFAIFTTYEDDYYDAFDSAPGTGNGLEFEELGDGYLDTDHCIPLLDPVVFTSEACSTSNNSAGIQPGSDLSANDVDTIEERFLITEIGKLTLPDLAIIKPLSLKKGSNPITLSSLNPPTTSSGVCGLNPSSYTWYTGTSLSPNFSDSVIDTSKAVVGVNYYWVVYTSGCFSSQTVLILTIYTLPEAKSDSYDILEDFPGIFDVTNNDVDEDGDTISLSAISLSPQYGTAEILNDTDVLYIPKPDFNGIDTFKYQITSGSGVYTFTAEATVTVNVTAVNNAPTTVNDYYSINEDGMLSANPTSNDKDVDGDIIRLVDVIDYSGNGKIIIDLQNNVFQFIPNSNLNGNISLTYDITDGQLETPGTIFIEIKPVNDPPIANPINVSIDSYTITTIDMDASDVDGDILSIFSISTPFSGSATILNSTSIKYIPNPNSNGDDTFTYTVTDGNNAFSTADINIIISTTNHNPIAYDDSISVIYGSTVNISVLLNDVDVDFGDLLSIELTNPNSQNSVPLSISNSSYVTYSAPSSGPTTDTFSYKAVDSFNAESNVANVYITLLNSNTPPIAVGDSFTLIQFVPKLLDVLLNDIDDNPSSLFIVSVYASETGNATIVGNKILFSASWTGNFSIIYTISDGIDVSTANINLHVDYATPTCSSMNIDLDENSISQSFLIHDICMGGGYELYYRIAMITANGDVNCVSGDKKRQYEYYNTWKYCTYTPNAHFFGIDLMDLNFIDYYSFNQQLQVIFTVNPIPDDPVAIGDVYNISQGSIADLDVLKNDYDYDGNNTFHIFNISTPTNGSASFTNDIITYTPNASYSGLEMFRYWIIDDTNRFAWAYINITVFKVNRPPVVTNASETIDEDSGSQQWNVIASDPDNDILTLVSATANHTSSINIDQKNMIITYTPEANYYGDDLILFVVTDSINSTTGSIKVTINSVPDGPTCSFLHLSSTEDQQLIYPIGSQICDNPDDYPLFFSGCPKVGLFSTVSCNQDTLIYTPNPNQYGEDSFTVAISNEFGTSFLIINVSVASVHDEAKAIDDSAIVVTNNCKTINVLANDLNVDNDPLTIINVSKSENADVSLRGSQSIRYCSINDFIGDDTITYVIEGMYIDSTYTSSANVTIKVIPEIYYIAIDDERTFDLDTNSYIQIDVLKNDINNALNFAFVSFFTQPTFGSVSFGKGYLSYSLSVSPSTSSDTFHYTVSVVPSPPSNTTVKLTATVTIDYVYTFIPTVYDDSFYETIITFTGSKAFKFDVLLNDDVPHPSTSSIQLQSFPQIGIIEVVYDADIDRQVVLFLLPRAPYFITQSFEYAIYDSSSQSISNIGNVTFEIAPLYQLILDAPQINFDQQENNTQTMINFATSFIENSSPIAISNHAFIQNNYFTSSSSSSSSNTTRTSSSSSSSFTPREFSSSNITKEDRIARLISVDCHVEILNPKDGSNEMLIVSSFISNQTIFTFLDDDHHSLHIFTNDYYYSEERKYNDTSSSPLFINDLQYVNIGDSPTSDIRHILFTCTAVDSSSTAVDIAPAYTSIDVIAIADAPIIDLNSDSPESNDINLTFSFLIGEVAVCPMIQITDLDSQFLTSCEATITSSSPSSPLRPSIESLSISFSNSSTSSSLFEVTYNSSSAILEVKGNNTIAMYVDVMSTLTYHYPFAAEDINRAILIRCYDDTFVSSDVRTAHISGSFTFPSSPSPSDNDTQNVPSPPPPSSYDIFPSPSPLPLFSFCPIACDISDTYICVDKQEDCIALLPWSYYTTVEEFQNCFQSSPMRGIIPQRIRIVENTQIVLMNSNLQSVVTIMFPIGSLESVRSTIPISDSEDNTFYLSATLPAFHLSTSECEKYEMVSEEVNLQLLINNVIIPHPVFSIPVHLTFTATIANTENEKDLEMSFWNTNAGKYDSIGGDELTELICSADSQTCTYSVTVKTSHFTNFAVLLQGTNGGNGETTVDRVISYLSLAFILLAILVVIVAVIVYETRFRLNKYKLDKDLDEKLHRASELSSTASGYVEQTFSA